MRDIDEIARAATHRNGCAYHAQDLDCPFGCEKPDKPEMALRPYHDDPDRLDDVVVKNVAMFRAEMMDDGDLWMACYFDSGEDLHFRAVAGKSGRAQLVLSATTVPDHIDIDKVPA